ncbi:copper chaperone PCu(A)C [Avibacterium sp. 20-126]|uniref:copper chaperone PCu(A)C n=1 Tax=Avibacterium sp. 20-126 TaxID=2911524 RepID=UPI0021864438|nr:copper chaperone PCu(A)C [Avibacterium sp. 20-126]
MQWIKKSLLICTALFPLISQADMLVSQATMFATDKAGEPSAIFMQLQNTGDKAVHLALLESEQPSRLALHGMQNGKMIDLDGIEIPAKQTISLKRGGLHIMVFDLLTPIKQGSPFPLTLYFDDGEVVKVQVAVQ